MILGASVREAKRKFDFASIWRRNVYSYGPGPHSFSGDGSGDRRGDAAGPAIARGGATGRGHRTRSPPQRTTPTRNASFWTWRIANEPKPDFLRCKKMKDSPRRHAPMLLPWRRNKNFPTSFPEKPNLEHRLAANTKTQLDQAGENVAFAPTVERAQDSLMHSPPHRANLLNAGYNVAGFSVVRSGSLLYVTQDFGHSLTSLFGRRSGSPHRPQRGPHARPDSPSGIAAHGRQRSRIHGLRNGRGRFVAGTGARAPVKFFAIQHPSHK